MRVYVLLRKNLRALCEWREIFAGRGAEESSKTAGCKQWGSVDINRPGGYEEDTVPAPLRAPQALPFEWLTCLPLPEGVDCQPPSKWK